MPVYDICDTGRKEDDEGDVQEQRPIGDARSVKEHDQEDERQHEPQESQDVRQPFDHLVESIGAPNRLQSQTCSATRS